MFNSTGVCDDLSGMLIFPMLVFSPWAFGTTEPWSIWTMNMAGYALGILLLAKLFIREVKGYPALRWENFSKQSGTTFRRPQARGASARPAVLAGLTLAVLAFCLVSALNAGATYNPDTRLFEYHPYLRWLPHSLDSHRTWFIFWTYLGLAGSFWAVRDWLLGMTAGEERAVRRTESGSADRRRLPDRLRALLWVLCLNGALLGVEASSSARAGLQQIAVSGAAAGESRRRHPVRAVCLSRECRSILQPALAVVSRLLVDVAARRRNALQIASRAAALRGIMAACPIISTSRGGALVAAGILDRGGDLSERRPDFCLQAGSLTSRQAPLANAPPAGTVSSPWPGVGLVFRLEFAGAAHGTTRRGFSRPRGDV